MDFVIQSDWKGAEVVHDPVRLRLSDVEEGMRISIKAPFFDDPGNPGGQPGRPFDKLWDYEVVEVFFLDSQAEEYLEAEFCPHGQHQILVLKGCHKIWKSSLSLEGFKATTEGSTWTGEAILPWGYFPKQVDMMNAYAIHGSDNSRQYEALYPATGHHEAPDFHRLEYFKPFQLDDRFVSKRRAKGIWN